MNKELNIFLHYLRTALDVTEIANLVKNYIMYFGPLNEEQEKLVDSKLAELEKDN